MSRILFSVATVATAMATIACVPAEAAAEVVASSEAEVYHIMLIMAGLAVTMISLNMFLNRSPRKNKTTDTPTPDHSFPTRHPQGAYPYSAYAPESHVSEPLGSRDNPIDIPSESTTAQSKPTATVATKEDVADEDFVTMSAQLAHVRRMEAKYECLIVKLELVIEEKDREERDRQLRDLEQFKAELYGEHTNNLITAVS